MTRVIFLFIGLAVVLGGCATMSEEECQTQNWEALGRADGINGENVSRFQRYSKACSNYGIAPDFEAWDEGRLVGLKRFCTPQGVYSAGMRGYGDTGECGFDPDLNRIHRVTTHYNSVRRALDSARNSYSSLLSGYDHDRGNIRQMRRKLRRDDLGKDERKRAERSLRNSLQAVDRFPYEESQARFRLDDLERSLDRAQADLMELEYEYGLGGGRY